MKAEIQGNQAVSPPEVLAINPPMLLTGRGRKVLLFLCDTILIFGTCIVFSFWRIGPEGVFLFEPGGMASVLVLAICLLVSVAVVGGYRPPQPFRRLSMAAEFFLGCGVGLLVALFVIYVVFLGTDIETRSRIVLVIATVVFAPCALLIRWFFDAAFRFQLTERPLLFLGTEASYEQFKNLGGKTGINNPIHHYSVTHNGIEKFEALLNDHGLKDYEAVILENNLAVFPKETLELLMRIHFNQIPVLKMRSYFAAMHRQVPAMEIDASWIFGRDFNLAGRSFYHYTKRIVDVAIALVSLVILAPLCLLIAATVKLGDGGPVLFTQERTGRNGRVFRIIKFRTMAPGSEAHGAYTKSGDRRITHVGRILRPLRLDEIPQLLNVLKGDMSLIGPRPEWVRLIRIYEKEIPYYHLRHLVKPGLTGWAQLNFPYGESTEDAREKLRYDLYYIEYYSPSLDLEILLKTLLHVCSFKGR